MTGPVSGGGQSLLAMEGNVVAASPAAPDRMSRREIVSAMVASLIPCRLFIQPQSSRGARSHASRSGRGQRGAFQNGEGLLAEDLEHVGQVGQLLAAGRRLPADIVEDLAVLQAVIGQPL